MPTILNFGSPRSGTSFIANMLSSFPDIKTCTKLNQILPHIYDDTQKISDDVVKILSNLDKNAIYHMKIGEGTSIHPMNFQIYFDKFCNLLPKPIILIRTYRHPENIYKSLLERNGKINVIPRFNAWTKESVAAMLLSEYAGYLAIKNDYNILLLDFDNKESMITSLKNCTFLYRDITDHCIDFIENKYNKVYVRQGIRSKKVTIDISRSEKSYFAKLNVILASLKESFDDSSI